MGTKTRGNISSRETIYLLYRMIPDEFINDPVVLEELNNRNVIIRYLKGPRLEVEWLAVFDDRNTRVAENARNAFEFKKSPMGLFPRKINGLRRCPNQACSSSLSCTAPFGYKTYFTINNTDPNWKFCSQYFLPEVRYLQLAICWTHIRDLADRGPKHRQQHWSQALT